MTRKMYVIIPIVAALIVASLIFATKIELDGYNISCGISNYRKMTLHRYSIIEGDYQRFKNDKANLPIDIADCASPGVTRKLYLI